MSLASLIRGFCMGPPAPAVGSRWEIIHSNPYKRSKVTVLSIKEGWVEYREAALFAPTCTLPIWHFLKTHTEVK